MRKTHTGTLLSASFSHEVVRCTILFYISFKGRFLKSRDARGLILLIELLRCKFVIRGAEYFLCNSFFIACVFRRLKLLFCVSYTGIYLCIYLCITQFAFNSISGMYVRVFEVLTAGWRRFSLIFPRLHFLWPWKPSAHFSFLTWPC